MCLSMCVREIMFDCTCVCEHACLHVSNDFSFSSLFLFFSVYLFSSFFPLFFYLCLWACLCVCLSVSLSVCVYVFFELVCVCVCVCLWAYLTLCISVKMSDSVCMSQCLTVFLCLWTCLTVHVSLCVYVSMPDCVNVKFLCLGLWIFADMHMFIFVPEFFFCFFIQVLAVFTEIGVNNVLYFIVFGESLLNGKSNSFFLLLTLDKHKMLSHQSHSVAVSALDCGLEGLWFDFESYQRHVGFFSLNWLLPRAGCAMGPVGRLRPCSWASSASRMHLRVLL